MKKYIEKLFLFVVAYIVITVITWVTLYLFMYGLFLLNMDLFHLVENNGKSEVFVIFFVATFILTVQYYKILDEK